MPIPPNLEDLPGFDPDSPSPPVRVLVVDDDLFNREGVRLYLSRSGYRVHEAGDVETAWQQAAEHQPDVAVIDIALPARAHTSVRPSDAAGLALARRLKETYPVLGIVLFSAYEDHGRDVFEMVRAGLRGLAYKLKGCHPSALIAAIDEVHLGRVVLDAEVHAERRQLVQELRARLTPDEAPWVDSVIDNLPRLTPRESEVAYWLAASHNTDGIAHSLGVNVKTAENYITRVYQKLGLTEMASRTSNLRQAVVLAKACMIADLQRREPE